MLRITLIFLLASCTVQRHSENAISTISVSTLDDAALKAAYGDSCSRFDFTKSPTIDKSCAGIASLLQVVHLSITPKSCDSNVAGTSLPRTKMSKEGLQQKIIKGCDYTITIELGDDNLVYLSNDQGEVLSKDALNVSAGPVAFAPKVRPTADGLRIGFPGEQTIEWDGKSTVGDNVWKLELKK